MSNLGQPLGAISDSFSNDAGAEGGLDSTGLDVVLLLEERVTALVERHRAARTTIEELRARVVEQNQAIAAEREQNVALRAKVDEHEATRADLRKRVDRLLEVVVQLEREAGDDSATADAEGAQEPESQP
jgi:DNA repair exonuclease SbcCD ATPase subunit